MPGRVCECVDWWGHPSFPALLAFFGLVPMSRGTLVSGFHSPLSTRALDSSLARGSGVASRSLNPPSAGRACLVPRTSRGPLFSVLLSQSQQNQQSRHGRWDFGSRGSRPNPFPRGGIYTTPRLPHRPEPKPPEAIDTKSSPRCEERELRNFRCQRCPPSLSSLGGWIRVAKDCRGTKNPTARVGKHAYTRGEHNCSSDLTHHHRSALRWGWECLRHLPR